MYMRSPRPASYIVTHPCFQTRTQTRRQQFILQVLAVPINYLHVLIFKTRLPIKSSYMNRHVYVITHNTWVCVCARLCVCMCGVGNGTWASSMLYHWATPPCPKRHCYSTHRLSDAILYQEAIARFCACFVLKTVNVFLLMNGYWTYNSNYTWRFKFPHSPDNWISSL